MKRFFKNESASATFLVTISFTGLLALTGLVVDGGLLYSTHSHLQKSANAAALSGGQELTRDDEVIIENIVEETLDHHEELDSLMDTIVVLDERVTVNLKKPTDTTFMRLFGIDSIDVNVKATARIGQMGRAMGAAPLGIDESVELNYGEEYTLKVDEDGVEAGNFGVLALDGPGSKTYKETLISGFDEMLEVGNVIDTQTGNIAGPTEEATDILVNSCDDMYERDCPRVLLVPVYKPHDYDQNQMKQVEITGFAYFYLTEPMDGDTKEIKGQFLERTGSGHELDEAVERGAFIVRLTD
ncbi:Tad domain-containing protein [Aquisalibacillus elongatus]|uniref:Putative Flp pilus-assembly TadE/G-like protein n=1 Tax=Aquisalibacillus elongatus TaxID=485577 RepID=A0A3N5C3E6_9BACI|nr:Tad domain-containing protein [Aquisalibacillus elongatus]RPF53962.1 putative Flp pilus-assembly TadE/G-like protein [Aquisalibacillus elongatus]